jgi:S-adenosylmethionine/arginine decarboxylase-like enzyme
MQHPPIDEISLNIFLRKLVSRVRMKVVGGPISVYVNEPGNKGITGTVTLATSHAAMHVWDEERPSLFQFDLYSCTWFKPEEVLGFIDETFRVTSASYMFMDRNDSNFRIMANQIYK